MVCVAEIVALNVGSGQRPFHSSGDWTWINIDAVAHEGMPEPDLICNGHHLPYADETADMICFHHVLEHFGCGEGKGLMQEAWRVLKPGGRLLVFVPDMRKLVKLWFSEEISTQIYMTNLYGAYMGHEEDRHKWGYDESSLREFLTEVAEWKQVPPFNWRTIPGADIARDDRWILGMEAIK